MLLSVWLSIVQSSSADLLILISLIINISSKITAKLRQCVILYRFIVSKWQQIELFQCLQLQSIMFQNCKEEIKKKLCLKDLPIHLQQKYKNSPIFEKENINSHKKLNFDLHKLHARKAEKQKTIEEKLEEFHINPTEEKYLMRVFNQLSACYANKYFTEFEVRKVLKKMGVKMRKSEVERMLWQFDDRLDKKITEKEYINMYKRCSLDKKAAQSKNLFHFIQFLMYCRPGNYRITVEDTLELLFVRAKIEVQKHNPHSEQKDIIRKLQQQIDVIFEGEQKTAQGLQKEIGFKEYLQRINKRAVQMRKREIEKAKSALKYGSKCIENED